MDDRQPFVLVRASAHTWLIQDLRFGSVESERVIARINAAPDDVVDVVWMTSTPLPTRYADAHAVLDDLMIWTMRHDRSTRPVPIPHHQPVHAA